jgi:hypothetical protein
MSMRDDTHLGPGSSRPDDAIDAAARELTRGEPSPRLRHQVRSRIQRRPAGLRVPALVAIGGAAAIVLAVFMVWNRPDTGPDQQAAVTPAPVATVQQPAEPTPAKAPAPLRAGRRPRTTRPTRALEPIDPLVIEPIAMPPLAVTTSSGVMPIDIDYLQIEPLQIQ